MLASAAAYRAPHGKYYPQVRTMGNAGNAGNCITLPCRLSHVREVCLAAFKHGYYKMTLPFTLPLPRGLSSARGENPSRAAAAAAAQKSQGRPASCFSSGNNVARVLSREARSRLTSPSYEIEF